MVLPKRPFLIVCEVKFQFWNIKLNGCYNMCAKSNQVIIYEYMTENEWKMRGRVVLFTLHINTKWNATGNATVVATLNSNPNECEWDKFPLLKQRAACFCFISVQKVNSLEWKGKHFRCIRCWWTVVEREIKSQAMDII